MTKKIHYEEHPFGKVKTGKRVQLSALPTPEQLAEAEKTRKVTLALSEKSLRFFKTQSEKYGIPYQVMIRRLLDEYSLR